MSSIWLSRAHERKLEVLKNASVNLEDAELKDLVEQREATKNNKVSELLRRSTGTYCRRGGCGRNPTHDMSTNLLYENDLNRIRVSGDELLIQRHGSKKWFRHLTLRTDRNNTLVGTQLHKREENDQIWFPWIGAAGTVDALYDKLMGITWYRL